MLLLVSWMAICAHYFGDYNTIKDTWREQIAVYGSTFSAIAYCVNIFVPPIKIVRYNNEFLAVMRFINWMLWVWKLVKIFSGYVFVAIFLVPVLFLVFWNTYTSGYIEGFDFWKTLKSDPDFGQWALAAFSIWWLTLSLRLMKLSQLKF